MKYSWRNYPEFEGLTPSQEQEVWQAGFGAVSATRTHALAAACIMVSITIFVLGISQFYPGFVGRFIGVSLGFIVGGLGYERIMYRGMRPHFLKRISQGFSD